MLKKFQYINVILFLWKQKCMLALKKKKNLAGKISLTVFQYQNCGNVVLNIDVWGLRNQYCSITCNLDSLMSKIQVYIAFFHEISVAIKIFDLLCLKWIHMYILVLSF